MTDEQDQPTNTGSGRDGSNGALGRAAHQVSTHVAPSAPDAGSGQLLDELWASDEASALTNRAAREIERLLARVAELEWAIARLPVQPQSSGPFRSPLDL